MRIMRRIVAALAVTVLGSVAVASRPAAADGPRDLGGPLPHSVLAASWWKWALEAPTPTNPFVDTTGANCATGQPKAFLWYLAGTLGGDPVSRDCVVPPGRALFFPMVNLAYFAFTSDAPETRTVDYVRSQVACETGSVGAVTIDGRPLPPRLAVHERSAIFDVQLPPDNVFGAGPDVIPGLLLSPSADQGTYVLLPPLRRGQHTITIHGQVSATCGAYRPIDVTYHLTVR